MVAFHGSPSYRIAGILPAVFLIGSLASCRQTLSFLPAARQQFAFSERKKQIRLCARRSQATCRLSLSFLPATRQPMPPGMVAFHGSPSYRIAGILPAVFLIGSLASCRLFF
jgi:hypothetical protein